MRFSQLFKIISCCNTKNIVKRKIFEIALMLCILNRKLCENFLKDKPSCSMPYKRLEGRKREYFNAEEISWTC